MIYKSLFRSGFTPGRFMSYNTGIQIHSVSGKQEVGCMRCTQCGSMINPGNKFCAGCGATAQAGGSIQNAAKRVSDEIDYVIIGDDMQAVIITLDPGEGIRSEAGSMLYMEDGIKMETGATGGIWKGIKRMFTGESFFQTTFTNAGTGRADVSFAAPYPGRIIPIDLASYQEFIVQKEAFLCAANGVDLDIAFTKKLGAGFFGGEGFILQRLKGDGFAFIHAGGTIFEKDLAPGQNLRVDTGCIVGFQPSVKYDIQFIGGFKNTLFGGEGLFLATLTGPGKVFLQTLPFNKLADRVVATAALRSGSGGESRGGASGVLGALGGLMGRD